MSFRVAWYSETFAPTLLTVEPWLSWNPTHMMDRCINLRHIRQTHPVS